MSIVGLALLVGLASACSKGHSPVTRPTATSAAGVTAHDAVLTLADVPSGWQSEPPPSDVTDSAPGAPSGGCDQSNPPPIAVAALEEAQSTLLSGPTEELSNTTWRYASPPNALTQFTQLGESYDRCRDASVAASKTAFASDQASSDLTASFSVDEIPMPVSGADVRAFRSTVAAFSGDEQVDGQLVDIIFIRSGALVSILTHTSISPDMTLLKGAVTKLAKKMNGPSR